IAGRPCNVRRRANVVSSRMRRSNEYTAPRPTRSNWSVVIATCQPSFSRPTRFAFGTRTSSKNTSLNSASPVICTSGRTVIPGLRMSTSRYEMPRCFGAAHLLGVDELLEERRAASAVLARPVDADPLAGVHRPVPREELLEARVGALLLVELTRREVAR